VQVQVAVSANRCSWEKVHVEAKLVLPEMCFALSSLQIVARMLAVPDHHIHFLVRYKFPPSSVYA